MKDPFYYLPAEQTAKILSELTSAGPGARLAWRWSEGADYPSFRFHVRTGEGKHFETADGCDETNNSLRCPPVC